MASTRGIRLGHPLSLLRKNGCIVGAPPAATRRVSPIFLRKDSVGHDEIGPDTTKGREPFGSRPFVRSVTDGQ